MPHRLIPLVLALALAGQPIGQAWCSVTCGGMHTAQSTAPARTHSCHPVAEQATSETAVPALEQLPTNAAHANAPCRQSTGALIGEPARGRQLGAVLFASAANDLAPAALPTLLHERAVWRNPPERPAPFRTRSLPLELSASLRI